MRVLVVVSRSDSFSTLWPELAATIGAELCLQTAAPRCDPAWDVVAALASVAGAEEDAASVLRAMTGCGLVDPLVVGASGDHRFATSMVRSGAEDYFCLPEDLDALRQQLSERARKHSGESAGREFAASERARFDFSRIVGRSAQLRAALERAARIIPRDRAAILVTGETGTGKELLAQAIHYNGPRAARPFIEINCAAIPSGLLESELYGHEKGAFTDARTSKPGLFESAHGGTLFLDEIGHMPFDLQGKLLKAIEEKKVRRLGAVKAHEVDVRIIAATHVDLAAAVRRGEFREDLLYRLSVVPIHLPPLRERGDDVLLLAEHFLDGLARQYDLPAPPLTPDLRQALLAHAWPGNVRELRNSLERALLLGDGGIDPRELFAQPMNGSAPSNPDALPFPARLNEIEQAAARLMVERMRGNKSAAADALGISRGRLYRLLGEEELVPE